MKKTNALLALLALLLCLAGCFGRQYSEKEETAVRQKGEQMMREWLARTYPEAELVSVEPYVSHNLGVAPYELTDAIYGTFRSGGGEQSCWLDTASGVVYFEQDEETAEQLRELCAAYAAEALGFGDGCEINGNVSAYIDIGASSASDAPPDILPADFVRSGGTLEDFVRSPKERPAITVDFTCRVPDAFDVSSITFAQTRRILSEYGLLLDRVTAEGGDEYAELRAGRVTYQRMEFRDLSDFRVWMPVYERVEKLDGSTGKVETTTVERDAGRDITIERAEDGFYKPEFPNGWFPAQLYACEGSEMPRHTYYYVSDNDKIVELEWQETERGWRLGSERTYLSDLHPFAEMK